MVEETSFLHFELDILLVLRYLYIFSIALILIQFFVPSVITGSTLFWILFVANPFLALAVLKRERSSIVYLLLSFCGGFFSYLSISLILMVAGAFVQSGILLVLLIESLLLLCIIEFFKMRLENRRVLSLTIQNKYSRVELLCVGGIVSSGILYIGFTLIGIFEPFAQTTSILDYFSPITILILLPLAISVYVLLRRDVGLLSYIAIFVLGIIVRIIPFLLYGPVWANDTFYHLYVSDLFQNEHLFAFDILYSQSSFPNYPLFSFHILVAMGNLLIFSKWFFVQFVILSQTVFILAIYKIFKNSEGRTRFFALFLATCFPILISYFSRSRPYELVSAILCLAVAIAILHRQSPFLSKREALFWNIVLLIIAISIHLYGIMILFVILADLATSYSQKSAKNENLRIILVSVIAVWPIILIITFFSFPEIFLHTPFSSLNTIFAELQNTTSRTTNFAIWWNDLFTRGALENIYSSFVNFYPVVGFTISMIVIANPNRMPTELLRSRTVRILLVLLSVQIISLWFIGFFFIQLILPERLGVNLGWIVISIGIIFIGMKIIEHRPSRMHLEKLVAFLLVFVISFGIVVGTAVRAGPDEGFYEMLDYLNEEASVDDGIASSLLLRKMLIANGFTNVRGSAIAFQDLSETNFTYSDVVLFSIRSMNNVTESFMKFIVIHEQYQVKGINETQFVIDALNSPWITLSGNGTGWTILEILVHSI